MVLVGVFLNPFSKLIPSLCNKSVVTLDHYSDFQFRESSTGPVKVILMPASGFHKAEGTAKFQKTSASTQDLLKRTWKTTQAVCVDMNPWEEHPHFKFHSPSGKLWIKTEQLHSLLILNRIGYQIN